MQVQTKMQVRADNGRDHAPELDTPRTRAKHRGHTWASAGEGWVDLPLHELQSLALDHEALLVLLHHSLNPPPHVRHLHDLLPHLGRLLLQLLLPLGECFRELAA